VCSAAQQQRILLAQAPQPAQGQPSPTPQERAAMLRQWLQSSQQQLRAYKWVETTVVSVNGEQKSSSQKSCYYGVDGTLEKVELPGATQAELPGGPLRRAIAEGKKQKMTEYMQNAVALVHSYIPPSPDVIQQAVSAGNMSVSVLDPGQQVQLQFKNYLKAGDMLAATIDLPTNRLLAIQVNSYLEDTADAVNLNVTMSVLPDGTLYAETSTLNAPAKNITVTVTNSGFLRNGN
jgi:hypothetical protein